MSHGQTAIDRIALRDQPPRPALPSAAGVRRAGRPADACCRATRSPTSRRRCRKSAEIDLVRHFVNLSTRNMSIDTNFYPLGSCTMKYNPKRHERLAALPGLANLHPLQADESCQGMLQILWEMQNILAEIAGLDAVSLQPAAGAQGELTALLVAAAYFRDRGEERTARPHPRQRPRHQPRQRRHCRLRGGHRQEHRPRPGRSRRPQGQARRAHRRVHDHQPEHAGAVRRANRDDHAR